MTHTNHKHVSKRQEHQLQYAHETLLKEYNDSIW
jgi:hypothetical protein